MNFAVYTSYKATRLRKYLEIFPKTATNIKVVIYDGNHSDPIKKTCEYADIEFVNINYDALAINRRLRNKYCSVSLLEVLKKWNVDFCLCFGTRILEGEILEHYKNRIINFHPSILPAFPGLKAVDQALEYGALMFGNTAHFIDEGVDTGPIIMQSFLPRSEYRGYDSVLNLQVPMIAQIIKWLEEERIQVRGRIVEVVDGKYDIEPFLPNLEFEYNVTDI